jgi:hypothetical protein
MKQALEEQRFLQDKLDQVQQMKAAAGIDHNAPTPYQVPQARSVPTYEHQAPTPSKSQVGNDLGYKMAMKDYSRDPYVNEWQAPLDGAQMSSVALQAQGHQLPPRPKPVIKPTPYGVSIIQDPTMMDNKQYASGNNRGSLREIHLNSIHGQAKVEQQF